jgi:FkbH-like protein
MNNIYEHLSWLPQPPQDFQKRLNDTTTGHGLRELAKFSLDENWLQRLYKKTLTLQGQRANLLPLVDIKIGIVSNTTTKLAVPSLVGTALRFGVLLQVVETDFNNIAQEAFSSKSAFTGLNLNFLLIAIDYRGLPLSPCLGDKNSAEKNIEDSIAYINLIVNSLRNRTGAQIVIQNIAPLGEALSGSFESRLIGSFAWLISRFNCELDKLATADTFILDIAGLAANLGLANWHDLTQWNVAKLAFSQRYIPIYAEYVCRIFSARLGKSRRCLILDLDNTIWGGVIGDDGLEGILIGNGDPTAEAYLKLQRTILEFRERGVVLAVSSKNEDAIARQPFKEHPDMLLREEHIAVFQANWFDKASNIKEIAKMLSLSLESMVFLDDNPAERMQVRRELPEVAVPELPEDPALYARTLIAAGYFESIVFLEEDRKRANFYQANAKRAEILNNSSDIDTYLKALDMEISFTPFNTTGRARVSQLIVKSNQFNLTCKRYTAMDLRELESNENFYTRQIRLKDSFGDNGMISVIICKKHAHAWEIDTWLMSCRVLGRRVELAALQDIVKNAKIDGATKVIGVYIPTSRNIIVKNHYKNLGFTKISNESDSEKWELDVTDFKPSVLPARFIYV